MPGKSKEGGGLTSSPVYKKQGYGEGVSPFTMRSGNTTPFKQMGSSPLTQKSKMLKGTTIFGKEVSEIKKNITSKLGHVKRKVELVLDSKFYSNKYKAENPNLFKDAKINQPRFKAERKKLLK